MNAELTRLAVLAGIFAVLTVVSAWLNMQTGHSGSTSGSFLKVLTFAAVVAGVGGMVVCAVLFSTRGF